MQQENTIYVTINFKVYHKASCKLLNNPTIKCAYTVTDISGLIACKNCKPDWEEIDLRKRYCGEKFK